MQQSLLTAMLSWAYALGILGLSGTISCSPHFYYTKGPYRRAGDCNLCYADECIYLDQARCDYYVEADSMLEKDDNEDRDVVENKAIKKEVDELMFDLVDKGLSSNMECLPYVSRYTDCNKENVCLGCKTCFCDPDGKWDCTTTQHCQSQDAPLNIDHRVLVMVMEILIDSGNVKKVKRSVTDAPDNDKITARSLTLEQISEWLYGFDNITADEKNAIQEKGNDTTTEISRTNILTTKSEKAFPDPHTKLPVLTTTKVTTESSNIYGTDTDYVAFDEVLRSIAVDTKSYNRRKLPLENIFNNKTFDVEFMLRDEDSGTGNNGTDNFSYLVNLMDGSSVTESTVEGATKIVIDLLETAMRGDGNSNVTQDYEMYNKNEDIANAFENTNDIIEYNAVNIMKRDVSDMTVPKEVPNLGPTVTVIVNTTNTTHDNNTMDEKTIDLKDDVVTPLNKIIGDKKKELEDLRRIKLNLLKYVKMDDQAEDTATDNNTNNTYFSIYNLAMDTGLGVDLSRANPSGYDKYMFKLKSDIFEVISDVIEIQKFKNSDIPEDLKLLLHAMKRYVSKNKISDGKPKKNKAKKVRNFRRQMEQNFGRCEYISFKDCIVQVIEVIDKDMPKANALARLSPASRRIMKYIIKTHYIDELAVPGLKIHDPQYNLTYDLNYIGNKWQEMTSNIISGAPFVTLYRMKQLHFVLSMDIIKMNDALALIYFAHSRRMLHTLNPVSDRIVDKINAGLTAIHNKIQIIIRYFSQKPILQPVTSLPRAKDNTTTSKAIKDALDKKKKKRSFIKHIRSLLKNSKKDIAELLHRKVPKSEIVKQLAKKKLDELSEIRYNEYEETMKRWQKNLEMAQRRKRSILETFKTRIKNIIPKYLRHKVNPRIKENKKNATSSATRKAENRKKKRKAKRGRKGRKSTIPPINSPSHPAAKRPAAAKRHAATTKHDSTIEHAATIKHVETTRHADTTRDVTTTAQATPKTHDMTTISN